MTDIPQPPKELEDMTPDDWEQFLEHNDAVLIVRDRSGTHAFEWDDHYDELSFLAYLSQGYDYDGSRAALEQVAGHADGLEVQRTLLETEAP